MPIAGGEPMLMGVVSGKEANRIEKLDEESLKSEIVNFFVKTFKNVDRDNLMP